MTALGSGGNVVGSVAEIDLLRAVLGDVDRRMNCIERRWAMRRSIRSASVAVLRGVLTSAAALGGYAAHVEADRKRRAAGISRRAGRTA